MFILHDVNTNHEFPLRQPSLVIGRAADCDILLNHPRVSSRHAMIIHSGNDFVLTDLGSTNGTQVNGHPLTSSIRLRPGDLIDISGVVFRFEEAGNANVHPHPEFSLKESPVDSKPAVIGSLEVTDTVRLDVSAEAKLRAVLEFSRKLSNTLDMAALLPRILESLFTIFPQTDRGFVLLRHPATGQLQPRSVRHRQPDNVKPAVSRTVIDHVLNTGHAILSADAGVDDRFDSSQSIHAQQIRSIMCVPLFTQSNELLGVIQLESQTMKRPYRQEDLEVFVSISIQAARAMELARLHDELRDLEAATQIQKSFLPADRPKAPGLNFFDFYAPARQVGGDYYDYISLPGNRLAIALGDVSGKGVPAALLMARLSAAARFCLATEPTVAGAVRKLNDTMSRTCGDGRFVTFVVVVVELTTFKMTLVNAGHIPPLCRRSNPMKIESLGEATVDIPLGIFSRPYEEVELSLERGDTLLFYTDGVIEARNAGNELYGVDRLGQVMKSEHSAAESIGMAILADVRRFTGPNPLGDDLTIVTVGREP